MSQVLRFSFEVEGGDLSQAGEASSQMKRTLKKLGFPPEVIRKVSICMYEGEINMVIHADGGTADVEVGLDTITITLADRGPGIPDINLAMEPGWSTAREFARDLGFGAGMGLPNMKKHSDEMEIQSTIGVGTTVKMTINTTAI
jgi:anti-sigma regulatory factor (Ser/Thr protein kinase)